MTAKKETGKPRRKKDIIPVAVGAIVGVLFVPIVEIALDPGELQTKLIEDAPKISPVLASILVKVFMDVEFHLETAFHVIRRRYLCYVFAKRLKAMKVALEKGQFSDKDRRARLRRIAELERKQFEGDADYAEKILDGMNRSKGAG